MTKNFLALLSTFVVSTCISAQPLGSATADQLELKLTPPGHNSRSLRNLAPQAQSVDLTINFNFDSFKLHDSSKNLLDNLATAMKRASLINASFIVEGHTDAKGPLEYNTQLSERRAATVVNYLKAQGVGAERMTAQGKGPSELLRPEQPFSPENRRVRIIVNP